MPIIENNNNKKKLGPFFKEVAEREFVKKEPSVEKKEQIFKKNNNLNVLPPKNKEQNIKNVIKKEPLVRESQEQNGGLFIIPNFCEKKPKKPKEIYEKKEASIEIPQKDKKVRNF